MCLLKCCMVAVDAVLMLAQNFYVMHVQAATIVTRGGRQITM